MPEKDPSPPPQNPPVSISFSKLDKERIDSFLRDGDRAQELEIQYLTENTERVLDVIHRATAMYEKMIIADSTALALSITFLTALSTHLSGTHSAIHPHLVLLVISWCLLLVSIFTSFRAIVDRNRSVLVLLAKVTGRQSVYIHNRYQRAFISVSGAIEGELVIGDQKINLSDTMKLLGKWIEEAGKTRVDEITAYMEKIRKESIEKNLAKISSWSGLLGLVLMCIFIIRTISLLF